MIKIPKPRSGESEQDFVNRCIPYLIDEGKHPNTPEGRKRAAGECYGIYRNKSDEDLEEYKASGSHQDFVPQQNVMSRDYELDDIIEYDGKIGRIVKVID